MSAWLAVEIWAGQRAPAIVIPEGGDDIELRGDETSFVQVKSRREHLGDYTEGEAVGHIEDLWNRSLGSAPQPQRLELVLEREVAGLSPPDDHPAARLIEGPISTRLAKFSGASDLLPRTSIVVATSPQEWAISLIVDRLNCAPIAAQMCFAELLVRTAQESEPHAFSTFLESIQNLIDGKKNVFVRSVSIFLTTFQDK